MTASAFCCFVVRILKGLLLFCKRAELLSTADVGSRVIGRISAQV